MTTQARQRQERPLRVFVSCYFGAANKGDEAIFRGLLGCLGDAFGPVEVSAACRHRGQEAGESGTLRLLTPILAVYRRSRLARLVPVPLRMLGSLAWLRGWRGLARLLLPPDVRETLRAICQADLFIATGGGYLHDENTSYVASLIEMRVGRACTGTLLLAPQSIGPMRSSWGQKLAQRTLQRADHVFVRDGCSLDFVAGELGLPAAQRSRSPDLAFRFREADSPAADALMERHGIPRSGGVVGLVLRDWRFPYAPASERERLRSGYVEAIVALCRHVAGKPAGEVVILPQTTAGKERAPDDFELARAIAEAAGPRVHAIPGPVELAGYCGLIGACRSIVTTRLHSAILAIGRTVPFVAIGYLRKTRGALEPLGLGGQVLDIETLTAAGLIAGLEAIERDRPRVEELLRAASERALSEIDAGFVGWLRRSRWTGPIDHA